MKKLLLAYLVILVGFISTQSIQAAVNTNSIRINFIKIKEGCFDMGRDFTLENGYKDELKQHRVCIKEPFYLGETEVTQAQWNAIMDNNPSEFEGEDNPVETVSWDDVKRFITRLNNEEGTNRYRLPTEAEWEYAARAGSRSTYHFGNDKGRLGLGQYAWFGLNAGDGTHPVGTKRPNQWGLYDMNGNVWEWVEDWYGEGFYFDSSTNDPQGASSGRYRVNRGGGWNSSPYYLRSAVRYGELPINRSHVLGFRLVRRAE